jgi:oligopeptide transport system ATP-binding protein
VNGSPILELRDVRCVYPLPRTLRDAALRRASRSVLAVDTVSLAVHEGEMVALVGESGSGKTSLALAALKLNDHLAGEVRFCGRDLVGLPGREVHSLRKQMQMIYQDPYAALDPRFTVERTVTEPLIIHEPLTRRSDRRASVLSALARVGLTPGEEFLDRYPHELSGGQRQRVAIAASLVLQPRLLVADEPVSMLDPSLRAGIMAVLGRLRDEGLAILLITHDLASAAQAANRIAVMYAGRIVEEGDSSCVITTPKHPYTAALLAALPTADKKIAAPIGGEPPDPTRFPTGCRFHERCPLRLPQCHIDMPALAGGEHRVACHLNDFQPEDLMRASRAREEIGEHCAR